MGITQQKILKQCTVEGNVVKLPQQQLDRKLYLEVAKALQLIGGKWKGGKIAGFVFPNDPTELLAQIANGEKRNLKKEFQFFATPDSLADNLVEMADILRGHTILEPSAGQGAIIDSINRKYPGYPVAYFELMEINQTFLRKNPTANFLGSDFLKCSDIKFDRIIANPPFTKNQDIDHIRHMFSCLNRYGILVSIASKHWKISNNKKEKAFAKWLNDLEAEIIEIDSGTFKESGTMIEALIIKIKKES